MHSCAFIPEMLEKRATRASYDRGYSVATQEHNADKIRQRRGKRPFLPGFGAAKAPSITSGSKVAVYDAKNGTRLPGKLSGDDYVECAAYRKDSASYVYMVTNMYLRFLKTVLGVDGIDNEGSKIVSTIDFSYFFNNAFFDGTQMVYGSGDGITFWEFDRDATVISHELTHGLIENVCPLVYQDQPGALNESIADVFASCFVQWMDNTSPKDSSWMIGDHCMKDFGNVSYSLRSMSSPGEGFINHPILGSDPQRGHMDAYYSGKDDNGGVHINSGIPNRAFYLLCTRLEENMNFDKSWDIPLAIWYSALERCNPNCDFSRFAALTVESVNDHILSDTQVASAKEILKSCWEDVGVKLSNLE